MSHRLKNLDYGFPPPGPIALGAPSISGASKKSGRFTFDNSLLNTRLYKGSNRKSILSGASAHTTAGRSLSGIENVYAYNLPVYARELHNAYWYQTAGANIAGPSVAPPAYEKQPTTATPQEKPSASCADIGTASTLATGKAETVVLPQQSPAEKEAEQALLQAALGGHKDTVRFLLGRGVDPATRDAAGGSVLKLAAQSNSPEVIATLLDCGVDIETRNNNGRTALTIAAMLGFIDVVKLLIDRGADLETRDTSGGGTPLILSARMGLAEMVGILLDRGARIEEKDDFGRDALGLAARLGWVDVARVVIDRGADVEARDIFGRTPYLTAAMEGKMEILDYLVARGADKAVVDAKGSSPVVLAASQGHVEMVRKLMEEKDEEQSSKVFEAKQ